MLAYNAEQMLREATTKHKIHLSVLVAETALWANPAVHRWLLEKHPSGAYFPDRRRYKAGKEKLGATVDGVRMDNNSYANMAIKRALGLSPSQFVGFEACHVWPKTCYDERYHTVIANLVLLPRALASLSDHDKEVRAALQYRAYELYHWYPTEETKPKRPKFYPDNWRPPFGIPRMNARQLQGTLPMVPAGRMAAVAGSGTKDYTKYKFKNSTYGKCRLVLAVVQEYVRKHPSVSMVQLQVAFPDKVQGSSGIVRPFKQVYQNGDLPKRYFMKPEERIRIANGQEEAVVCTQWGTGNIGRFLDQAQSLTFEITPE
jgi:hypothetical protein